jgi:hypothetical protein
VLAEQKMMWPQELYRLRGSRLVKKDEVDLESTFSSNPANFVLVSQKRPFAVNQIDSWTLPIRERHPSLPIIDITIAHNLGYWWLNPVLTQIWKSSNSVNATFASIYASPFRSLTTEDIGIEVENGFLSYQFVVDSDLRIRWLSVGSANENELDRVSAVIRRLTAEFNTKPPKRVSGVADDAKQTQNEASDKKTDKLYSVGYGPINPLQ